MPTAYVSLSNPEDVSGKTQAQKLQEELARIVQVLPSRFPNIKLVYLSGRTYGGFAKTPLNPEPYAYESGFSVKWLIEQQLQGDPALINSDGQAAVLSAAGGETGGQRAVASLSPRAERRILTVVAK